MIRVITNGSFDPELEDNNMDVITQIPYGVEVMALIIAIASIVSAAVPDSKLPKSVAAVLNFLAANFGAAKNDPNSN